MPSFGRKLIGDPELRGKGLGQQMIRLRIDTCIKVYQPLHIDLIVWEDNARAIACYHPLGFYILTGESFGMRRDGQQREIFKMRIDLRASPALTTR